jgi:3-deoxy-manno-octulosonate cytidylyltransferase (CMP-KDO synthetase)
MNSLVVIPSRYGSTRFPGKSLALLHGKPLVQWVWEASCRSKRAGRVVVATDDARIVKAVKAFGGEVVMTKATHPSGTDRMAEVARKIKADVYVNVQGDEPLMQASAIDALIRGLGPHPMATLAHPLDSESEATDPNVVKVVCDLKGRALYFSRSPLPYPRQIAPGFVPLRHVGIYAYQASALRQFVRWPQSVLEKIESLEQLRALEHGMALRVIPTKMRCHGVDTPADLKRVEALLRLAFKS